MQYTEWATHQIFCVPDVKNKKSPNLYSPNFRFYCKLSKITLDFISELINLKYVFNIPFKIFPKTIVMGTSSQFHDGVQLNILLLYSFTFTLLIYTTLSSEILLLNWAQKKPLRRPDSFLNNNGNLNIQLN